MCAHACVCTYTSCGACVAVREQTTFYSSGTKAVLQTRHFLYLLRQLIGPPTGPKGLDDGETCTNI